VQLDAVEHRARRNSGLLQRRREFTMLMRARPLPQMPIDLVSILMTPELIGKLRIKRPSRVAHHTTERVPLAIIADCNRDPLIVPLARIGIMRRHYVVAVAELAAIAAVHGIVSKPFVHLADNSLAHARIDPLPFAGAIAMAQRCQRMKYDRRGNRVIGLGATSLSRRTTGIALRVEHPDEATGHRTPSDPL
jgi:hypothetical protein